MNVVFTPTAWEQYNSWLLEDKKMLKRINDLVKDIDRNGLLKAKANRTSEISKSM